MKHVLLHPFGIPFSILALQYVVISRSDFSLADRPLFFRLNIWRNDTRLKGSRKGDFRVHRETPRSENDFHRSCSFLRKL